MRNHNASSSYSRAVISQYALRSDVQHAGDLQRASAGFAGAAGVKAEGGHEGPTASKERLLRFVIISIVSLPDHSGGYISENFAMMIKY